MQGCVPGQGVGWLLLNAQKSALKLSLAQSVICAIAVTLTSMLIELLFTVCNCWCVSRQFTDYFIWKVHKDCQQNPESGNFSLPSTDSINLGTQISLKIHFKGEPHVLSQFVLFWDVLSSEQSFSPLRSLVAMPQSSLGAHTGLLSDEIKPPDHCNNTPTTCTVRTLGLWCNFSLHTYGSELPANRNASKNLILIYLR